MANPFNTPSAPMGPSSGSGYRGPGSELGSPGRGGWTWDPDADARFSERNGIDPTTGMLTGPDPLPPAGSALQWQGAHNRGVWNYQQSLMRSGIGYAQGALGLLQSHRPGGGAAIESGIYQGLAGLEFQRAAMTQPLDLLGDFRRDETARARMQANRAQERALGVQIATTAAMVGLAATGVGAAAVPALAAGLGSAAGAYAAGQSRTANDPGARDPYADSQQQKPGGPGAASPYGGGGGGAPAAGPGPTMQVGDMTMRTPRDPAMQSQGAPGAMQPQGMPQQQGQGQQPGGGQKQVQQGGGGGAMGMGAPPVGLDGNFMPIAYAANNAAQLAHPVQQLAVSRAAVAAVEGDVFFQTFGAAVNLRWRQRLAG